MMIINSNEPKKFIYSQSKYVQELDNESYEFLKDPASSSSSECSLIVFYAPWCPHCIHYANTYNDIAKENSRRAIMFYAVNCVEYRKICR